MVVFMEYQLVGWHSRTSGRVRAQGTRNGRNKELPITASCVRSAKRIMHGGIRLRAAYSDDKAARLTSPLFKSLSKRPPPPMIGHRRRSLPEQSCQSASGHFPGEPERLKLGRIAERRHMGPLAVCLLVALSVRNTAVHFRRAWWQLPTLSHSLPGGL
jgi:hypothetical protein